MKNSYKIALLAALGLASVSVAQAQITTAGDLIVGVYQPGNPLTTYVDIGQFSALTLGETWDISSALTAAGLGSLTSTAEFGVVGTSGNTIWATGAGVALSQGQFAQAQGAIGSIGINANTQAAGSKYAWDSMTFNDPPASGTVIASALGLVDATLGSQNTLFTDIGGTTTGRPPVTQPGSFSQDSYFTLTSVGGVDTLTYGSVAVPEPSTYGLLAGAGLLAVSLRNKLSRKNA